MNKVHFENDYNQFCLSEVLDHMAHLKDLQLSGYGLDMYTQSVENQIRLLIESSGASVYFLNGGTQVNMLAIAYLLKSYEAVIACDSGHIATSETGAIEAKGHKVLTCEAVVGKVTVSGVDALVKAHNSVHMVKPKMVFISQPTELGTLYSYQELSELSEYCRLHNLLLYVDGARLFYGLASEQNDVSLPQLADLADVFYIGGTKCGTLLGEALVFTDRVNSRDFRHLMKQQGALLAKGYLLASQFEALLKNDLALTACGRANQFSRIIKEAMLKKGYKTILDSYTNQQFFIVSEQFRQRLKDHNIVVMDWGLQDNLPVIRIVTSWATTEAMVNQLLSLI